MMFGVFALWIPFYLVNSGRRKEGRDRLRVQGQEIIALPVEAVVIAFSLGAPLTSLPPHPADQLKHIPSFPFSASLAILWVFSRKLVLAVGSKFFQFSQRLNSDKKLIEIGFLQSNYAFLENAIFGLYSDQNGENHGVVRCCL